MKKKKKKRKKGERGPWRARPPWPAWPAWAMQPRDEDPTARGHRLLHVHAARGGQEKQRWWGRGRAHRRGLAAVGDGEAGWQLHAGVQGWPWRHPAPPPRQLPASSPSRQRTAWAWRRLSLANLAMVMGALYGAGAGEGNGMGRVAAWRWRRAPPRASPRGDHE
jgi:hypothetical protein